MTRETGMNVKGVAVALALAVAAGLAGCGKKDEAVKIGHAGPLTGPIAHLGKDNENGVRMAIDDANATGFQIGGDKVKLELLSEDDQADPKQGTIVAQKLVDAKVSGVIGHLNSGTTIPASKIYHDAGIAQISPSATNVTYTAQGFKTAFRVMANDAQQGKVLGEYAAASWARRRSRSSTTAPLTGRAWPTSSRRPPGHRREDRGARIHRHDQDGFHRGADRIKGKKPDLLFYGGMDAQGGPMVKQIKNLGLNAKFMTGDGG